MSEVAFHDGENFIRNMVTVRDGCGFAAPLAWRRNSVGELSVPLQAFADDLAIDSEDLLPTLERMVRSAAAFIERRTAYVLIPGAYEVQLDSFGFSSAQLTLNRGPLRQITGLEYLTAKDTWVTVADLNYWTRTRQRDFDVQMISSFDRPTIWSEARQGGVRLTFEAGFDPQDSSETGYDFPIDDGLVTLWMLVTGHYLQNRELPSDRVEVGANALLGTYRQYW